MSSRHTIRNFSEIILSIWIIISLYVWFVLNGYPNLKFKEKLPACVRTVIAKTKNSVWPYVWREYIYAEKKEKRY